MMNVEIFKMDYRDFGGDVQTIQNEKHNIIGTIINSEDAHHLRLQINFIGLGTLNTPPGLLHFMEHIIMRDSYSEYILGHKVDIMNAKSCPTEMELYSSVNLIKNSALKLDQGFDKIINVFDSMKKVIDVMHLYSDTQLKEIMNEQIVTIDQEIIKSDNELHKMIMDATLYKSKFVKFNGIGTSKDIRKYKVSDIRSMMLDLLLNTDVILTLTLNKELLDKHDPGLYNKIEQEFYKFMEMIYTLRDSIKFLDKATKGYLKSKQLTFTGFNSKTVFVDPEVLDGSIPVYEMYNDSNEELKNTVMLVTNKPISIESYDKQFMASLCRDIISDYMQLYLRHERNLIYGYNEAQVIDLNNKMNNRGFIFHVDKPRELVGAIRYDLLSYILKDLTKSKLDQYIIETKMGMNHCWMGIVTNVLYHKHIHGFDEHIKSANKKITVKSVKEFIANELLNSKYSALFIYENNK